MLEPDRRRQVGHGAVELILGNAAYLVFTYLASFYLGRSLGPSGFGVLGAVIAAIAVANFASGAGTAQAIPLYLRHVGASGYRAVRAASVRAQAWTVLALCAALALAAWPLAALLGDPRVTAYMLLGVVTIPLYGALNLGLNLFSATGRFRERAVANGLSAAMRLAATVAFLALGWGIPGAVLGYATGAALAVAYVAASEWRFAHAPAGEARLGSRTMAEKAVGPFVVSMCVFLLFNLDIILVGALAGPEAGGRYAALSTLTKIPYYLFSALQTTTLASVAADAGARAQEVDFSVRLILLAWLPALVAFALFPAEILGFTFGEAFATDRLAVVLVAAGVTLVTIATIYMAALSASDEGWRAAGVAAGVAVVGLAGMGLLLPGFGTTGAGMGLVLAGGVGVAASVAAMGGGAVADLTWGSIARILAATAAGALAFGAAARGLPWWAALVLAAACQVALLLVLREPTFALLVRRLARRRAAPAVDAEGANAGGRP